MEAGRAITSEGEVDLVDAMVKADDEGVLLKLLEFTKVFTNSTAQ